MNNRFYQGHFSRRSFSQNFLIDQFIIKSIVSAINPKKDQTMVEIGPGLAALTEPIIKQLDHLTVIEIDRNLTDRLKKHPFLSSKITIYQEDVMTVNFNKFSEEMGRPIRVFGNLPYNISTSLMFYLFKYSNVIADMHFMLQKEVVDRIVAKPNSKAYGRLSIMAQYFCQTALILKVPSTAFIPQPKVESAVVRLIPHKILPNSVKDISMLSFIVTEAFKYRRKKIRNSLSNFFTTDILSKIGINSDVRADNISITQYCRMANYLSRIKNRKN